MNQPQNPFEKPQPNQPQQPPMAQAVNNPFGAAGQNPYAAPQQQPYPQAGMYPPQQQGDATGGVIPYKNVPALIAYYCGVFSLIPCLGVVFGLVAVVLGIMGLRAYSRNPQAHGVVHAWIGIVIGGLSCLAHLALIVMAIGASTVR